MIRYCLDTDVLIDAAKLYPRDPFRRLWDTLEAWGTEGRLMFPREVYDEVNKVDDEVSQWAKKNKTFFRAPEGNAQTNLRLVLSAFPKLLPEAAAPPFADPWLVAQAITEKATVVTKERSARGPGGRPKIPDVCAHFGVSCIKLLDLFRQMDLGY